MVDPKSARVFIFWRCQKNRTISKPFDCPGGRTLPRSTRPSRGPGRPHQERRTATRQPRTPLPPATSHPRTRTPAELSGTGAAPRPPNHTYSWTLNLSPLGARPFTPHPTPAWPLIQLRRLHCEVIRVISAVPLPRSPLSDLPLHGRALGPWFVKGRRSRTD